MLFFRVNLFMENIKNNVLISYPGRLYRWHLDETHYQGKNTLINSKK
jgi:hypothetical protein